LAKYSLEPQGHAATKGIPPTPPRLFADRALGWRESDEGGCGVPEHKGKSDKGFAQAVEDALKDVPGSGDFSVVLRVSLSPNPGKITYHVTLTGP
jgi:hypothetical protein